MSKGLLKSKGLQNNKNSSNVAQQWAQYHTQLSCSIFVATAITKSFHICSHQGIADHCKKEKPHKKTNTSKKG